jgi:hypothetical protein
MNTSISTNKIIILTVICTLLITGIIGWLLFNNNTIFNAQSRVPANPNCTPSPLITNPTIKTFFSCTNVEVGANLTIPGTKCTPSIAQTDKKITCTEILPGSVLSNPFVKIITKIGTISTLKINYQGTPQTPSLGYIAKNSTIGGYDAIDYFAVMDTQTKAIQHYRGDTVPFSLASVVKVFVAVGNIIDMQEGKYNLDSPAPFNPAVTANGEYGKTIRQNFEYMLGPSSNTATNILMDANGGFAALNAKLKKIGLTKTNVQCHLSLPEPKCGTKVNESTMRDLVIATNWIREGISEYHQAARKPMINTQYTHNHTNRVFNKTGMNSNTIADVGVFTATSNGIKKEFVFAVLSTCEDGSCNYYNDKTEPLAGTKPTVLLSDKRDPTSKAIQWIINDLETGFVIQNLEK